MTLLFRELTKIMERVELASPQPGATSRRPLLLKAYRDRITEVGGYEVGCAPLPLMGQVLFVNMNVIVRIERPEWHTYKY